MSYSGQLYREILIKFSVADVKVYAEVGAVNNDGQGVGILWAMHGDGPYYIENFRYDTTYVRTARACEFKFYFIKQELPS